MFQFTTFHSVVAAASAAIAAALLAAVALPAAHAQTCPFDDGNSSLAVEGVVLTRYALGITGAPLVASTGINAVDAPTVEAAVNCPSCGLNITGNPTMTVADATIISRRLAGFSGAALTDGVALGSGTRNTVAAVNSFLLSGCGATGGTVTSVTAGVGLTGGTITASGIIAADTAYLQRRIATACSAGSFVTAVAADGTPTCGTPAAGGSGTVTRVGAGYGLVANGPNVVGNAVVSNGLIELANGYILPQGCAVGQVPKSGGAGSWVCAADNAGSGATNAFVNGGNAFGVPGVLRTTDAQPLTVQSGGTVVSLQVATGSGLRITDNTNAAMAFSNVNVINGSSRNSVTAGVQSATIAGGGQDGVPQFGDLRNQVTGDGGTVGGGMANTAGEGAVVAGGLGNKADGQYSAVLGGVGGAADGRLSIVLGGFGSWANASSAVVLGGSYNIVWPGADNSVVMGYNAEAYHPNSFVFGSGPQGTITQTTGPGEFVVRAPGGMRFIASRGVALEAFNGPLVTRGWDIFDATAPAEKRGLGRWGLFMENADLVMGMPTVVGRTVSIAKYSLNGARSNLMTINQSGDMSIAGTFSQGSDRALKDNIRSISGKAILAKVAALPLALWTYKLDDKKQSHLGPMAKEFRQAFGLGLDEKTIATTDLSGVALAAIQGLNQKLTEQGKQIKAKDDAIARLTARLVSIEKRMGLK